MSSLAIEPSVQLPLIDGNAIRAEYNRRRWLKDNTLWVKERLRSFVWSKQRDILTSLLNHRKTAVASCHGPGKSFIAANAVAWWLDVHPPGKAAAVTTAPSDNQVKTILWKEIRRAHARGKLRGRTNQKQWLMTPPGKEEEIVGQGRKPNDYDSTAFQGIHSRWVLVVADEACGIPGPTNDKSQSLWDAADSLLSNDECRMLAIGNPDDPASYFEKICRPGSGWNVIWINAFDTPNFTGEEVPEHVAHELVGRTWVEEKRKAWAPGWTWTEDGSRCVPPEGEKEENANPLWISKVLGRFPKFGQVNSLIPILWVEQAMARRLKPEGVNQIGVDIGAGGDASVSCHRLGSVARIISDDHNPDTMETCGKVILEMQATGAELVKIDKGAMGLGIIDRGKEQNHPFVGIGFGEKAQDPERFANFKAEMYWSLRERFEAGDIDIDHEDEQLLKELCDIRWKPVSGGKIQIESKEEARRRLGRSPDRADALALAFCTPVVDVRKTGGLLF